MSTARNLILISCITAGLLISAGCSSVEQQAVEEQHKPEQTAEGVEAQEQPVVAEEKIEISFEIPVTLEKTRPEQTSLETAEKKEAISLALKFTPQDMVTYRVTEEVSRSVEWVGPAEEKPSQFKGGSTGNKAEIELNQTVKEVTDDGNAIVEVKITAIKYLGRNHDNISLEFDSSDQKDQANPLARLIGQTYTFELSKTGEVVKVIDNRQAQEAVKGNASANNLASRLLSEEVIKSRHEITALASLDKQDMTIGDTWSDVKNFAFGMLGPKTFEKIYTLDSVESAGDKKVVLIKMSAVPSAEMAEELHKEQGSGLLSSMFDNKQEYSGQLKLDLANGHIEQYFEDLRVEWVAVDPTPRSGKQPAALKMTAVRLHRVEVIK